MSFEKLWIGVKSISLISVCIGIFIIGAPAVKAIIGYFNAKEALYNEQTIRVAENLVSQRVEQNNTLLQEQIKGMNAQLLELAKSRDQTIIAFGEIVTDLKQDFKEQIGHVYKDAQDSSKDYVETVIKKTLSDKSEIPWSWAMYSPNIEGSNKWTTGTYPVKIHTKIALGDGEDKRKDAYVEAYMTSDIFKADKGKKFPLDISSIEWVEAPPKEKSFMFNPRFSLGMSISNELFPSLEFSFFSYGKTKGDMDWRILGLGFGANSDSRYLYLAPIEYNIGKPLPMMENLFLSPFIGLDENSSTIWGGQLQIPF